MIFVTSRQRNCGKVMHSVMSVCLRGRGGSSLYRALAPSHCTGLKPTPPIPQTYSYLVTMKHGLSVIRRLAFDWNTFSFHLLPEHYFAFFSDSSSNNVYVTAATNRVHLIQLRSSHYCYGGKCLVHIFPRFWCREKDEKDFKDLKEMPALPILSVAVFAVTKKLVVWL